MPSPFTPPRHPRDGTVYGVALNHAPHLARLGAALEAAPYHGAPRAPVLYLKPANTVAGPGGAVRLPPGETGACIGGTVAAVIGRPAAAVAEAEALAHVAGYVVAADVFLPHASLHRPAIAAQCLDGSCPLGDTLTPVADPAALRVEIALDGHPALSWSLADLVRPLPRLLAEVSAFMTLRPGDLLLAGVPDGAPLAAPGQRVAVSVLGLGRLEFAMAPPSAGDTP